MSALNSEDMEVNSVEMWNKCSGNSILVNINGSSTISDNTNEHSVSSLNINKILLVKDKYSISNAAYHELAMNERSLPRSCKIDKRMKEINERWDVKNTPHIGEN